MAEKWVPGITGGAGRPATFGLLQTPLPMPRFSALLAALALAVALPAPADASPEAPRVTFTNDTGMTVIYLHIAGCGESEGEPWSEMADWATDYLGSEVLPSGASHAVSLARGCYVMLPIYEDGTEAMERIEVRGAQTVWLTLG